MTLPVDHRDFTKSQLCEADLHPSPFEQFRKWIADVLAANISGWETITVATVSRSGVPSARTLYLRDFDERGFVFYTNYNSRKGQSIAENPHVALVQHWRELERQVCIEGIAEQVSSQESDAYFASRPVESQLGAWASQQSQPLASAELLEERLEQLRKEFGNGPIPRPPHWGGYRVVPNRIEFWQGRPSRLHDRFVYLLQGEGTWRIERLNP